MVRVTAILIAGLPQLDCDVITLDEIAHRKLTHGSKRTGKMSVKLIEDRIMLIQFKFRYSGRSYTSCKIYCVTHDKLIGFCGGVQLNGSDANASK